MSQDAEKVGVVVWAGRDLHTAPFPQHLGPIQGVEIQAMVELGVAGEFTESSEKGGESSVGHIVQTKPPVLRGTVEHKGGGFDKAILQNPPSDFGVNHLDGLSPEGDAGTSKENFTEGILVGTMSPLHNLLKLSPLSWSYRFLYFVLQYFGVLHPGFCET